MFVIAWSFGMRALDGCQDKLSLFARNCFDAYGTGSGISFHPNLALISACLGCGKPQKPRFSSLIPLSQRSGRTARTALL